MPALLRNELHQLEAETFEIQEVSDMNGELAVATSSSCSCSSCCSCSTSSCCSTSTSTSSCG